MAQSACATCPVAEPKLPPSHGSGADAPTGQNVPGLQGWQIMAPLAGAGPLLRAARCRIIARRGRRAMTSAREVGGVGVGALFARQRRRRASKAERAGPAGPADSLASLFLISASLTIIASDHAHVGSHGATAACCWLVKARAAKVPRRTGVALLLGLQLARIAKGAGGARECDGAALRTVVRLWASYRHHARLTTTACEAGGA
eukprot:scaffold38033_cov69-Phaeocystis_antarctica.AAC.5